MYWLAFCLLAQCVVSVPLYKNPLLAANTPDPGVVWCSELHRWYAVTTGCDNDSKGLNCFPIYSSADMATWDAEGYIFPNQTTPKWASSQFWAPELHYVNNQWLTYFSSFDWLKISMVVGVATSTVPGPRGILGPFVDARGSPLVAKGAVYSYDATFFAVSPTEQYLVWKMWQVNLFKGTSTPLIEHGIYAQQLNANGTDFCDPGSEPTLLLTPTEQWEKGMIEAPWIISKNDTNGAPVYYLFYSAVGAFVPDYCVGVAVSYSGSVLGPYVKPTDLNRNPILYKDTQVGGFTGPGHCSVVSCPERENCFAMFYHGQTNSTDLQFRNMMQDGVQWIDGWVPANSSRSIATPFVGTPSRVSLPVPCV